MAADTFANFSCDDHCRDEYFCIRTVSKFNNMTMHVWVAASERSTALAALSLALVFSATVSAAEPPVTVHYQSAFEGYRRYDAIPPTVAWRQANDAIGTASDAAANEMHMPDRSKTTPASTNETEPATPGDHQEHRQ